MVREAYHDSPDRVILVKVGIDGVDTEAPIRKYYPTAVFDNMGGFDTIDGRSYIYDLVGVSK